MFPECLKFAMFRKLKVSLALVRGLWVELGQKWIRMRKDSTESFHMSLNHFLLTLTSSVTLAHLSNLRNLHWHVTVL